MFRSAVRSAVRSAIKSAIIYKLLWLQQALHKTFSSKTHFYLILIVTSNFKQLWFDNFVPFKSMFYMNKCPF